MSQEQLQAILLVRSRTGGVPAEEARWRAIIGRKRPSYCMVPTEPLHAIAGLT
jgi:hypothetical protein